MSSGEGPEPRMGGGGGGGQGSAGWLDVGNGRKEEAPRPTWGRAGCGRERPAGVVLSPQLEALACDDGGWGPAGVGSWQLRGWKLRSGHPGGASGERRRSRYKRACSGGKRREPGVSPGRTKERTQCHAGQSCRGSRRGQRALSSAAKRSS